jgi:hypothetical protein
MSITAPALEFYVWAALPPTDRRRKYRPITGPWADLDRAKEDATSWERIMGKEVRVLDDMGGLWSA